jgi:aspartate/methionine/tyrosine aminotransferase
MAGRSERLEQVPPIGVDAMGAAADAARDPDMLRLENLDTDLRPPESALAATRSAIVDDDANSYLPFLGQRALRAAVARHLSGLAGRAYDPDTECIITAGGLNGCMVTLNALIDPGDEVVVTDPTYIGMLNRIRIAGGLPVSVPYQWDSGGWILDLDRLRDAVGPRTRAMFLMNPSMPSGAVLSDEAWDLVAELCLQRDLWLIYNAAMERILYDGRAYLHPASLPGMSERTLTIGSASKELRMIGWRVGWVAGPASIMREVALVSISDVVVPVGIAQAAAAAALSEPPEDVRVAVTIWEARRNRVVAELDGLPLRPAEGGWSMLLDAGELGFSGREASERLFRIGRIAATPMDNWGRIHGSQLVRFVFSNEPEARLWGMGGRVRRSLALSG